MQENDFITIHEPDGGSHKLHISMLEDRPLDLRDRNIKPSMPAGFKDTSQNFYTLSERYIKDHSDILNDLNINNPKDVVNLASKMNREMYRLGYKVNDTTLAGRDSCYRIAGNVGAILDSKGIKYKCYAGTACIKGKPEYSYWRSKGTQGIKGANHVWIETTNHIKYEWFNGEVNNISHFTINDVIEYKKGR